MNFTKLEIRQLRNIHHALMLPCTQFNLLIGDNGSGKTSLLEAIYYLSLGRSFRSHLNLRIINYLSNELMIYGQLASGDSLGIEKQASGKTRIRVNGATEYSVAKLAELLPVQLLNPDTYKLLEGGSTQRRQFLDWGVFHVEHQFLALWRRCYHLLQQRNAALKLGQSISDIKAWDHELIRLAEKMDEWRLAYFSLFLPVFQKNLIRLLGMPIDIYYCRGWPAHQSYHEVLTHAFDREKKLRYTLYGPHRADLKLVMNNIPVVDSLSRGQQKILAYALRIAQGKLLQEQCQRRCIYLIDDLAAELDRNKREILLEELAHLGSQLFITSVSPTTWEELGDYSQKKMFHVEQGNIISE